MEGSYVGSILIQLLPLAIGSMLMPTWVLLVLFMLRSGHGPVNALAFVAGATTVRLAQGIVFGLIFSAADVAHRKSAPGVITSTLLLVAGILLWASALKHLGKEGDPTARLRQGKALVASLTPLRALGLGMLVVVTSSRAWIFTLAAIGIIREAELGQAESLVAYLLYILGAELLLVAPILASIRSSARFDAAARWLEGHAGALVMGVSFVVGAFFFWRGITGLIG